MNEDKTDFCQFCKSVGRHWVELMSGGIVMVGLAVYERFSGQPVALGLYATVVAVFVVIACFGAWKTERQAAIAEWKKRIIAQQTADANRPAVVAELGSGTGHTPPLMLRNVSSNTAFNVRFLDATLGDRTLEADEVGQIVGAATATPRMLVHGGGVFWARDVARFFMSGFDAVGREQWPESEADDRDADAAKEQLSAMFGLAELVLPIAIRYRDLHGIEYVTHQEVVFEPISDRTSMRLVFSGRLNEAPALRRPYIVPGTRAARKARRL